MAAIKIKNPGTKNTYHGPYNRCIFCGSDGDGKPLTDEHAIPAAIGGQLILRKATCACCQKITSAFESKCINSMLEPIRHYYRFTAARGRINRLTVNVKSQEQGQRAVRLERGDYPSVFVLPVFDSPTIVSGYSQWKELQHKRLVPYFTEETNPNALRLLKAEKADTVSVTVNVQSREFGRMLAKIAHCYAVARVGLDGFVPLLRDSILNEDGRSLSHFVGGTESRAPITPPSLSHSVQIDGVHFAFIDAHYLAAVIDLFVGFPEAPRYMVVCGDFNAATELWQQRRGVNPSMKDRRVMPPR